MMDEEASANLDELLTEFHNKYNPTEQHKIDVLFFPSFFFFFLSFFLSFFIYLFIYLLGSFLWKENHSC